MQGESYTNPYRNDKVIRDFCQFFGRGDVFAAIYAIIAAFGSISIVGPPRIGKGSLLYCLRYEDCKTRYGGVYIDKLRRHIFVFIDMRGLTQRSWENFFKILNSEIVKECQGRVELAHVPIKGSEGFSALLDEIKEQGYSLVLAIDSFEKLRENERLSKDLPMFLRSESARVSYVVSSTIELHEIFPEEPITSPFYNIFPHRIKIGGLAPADAHELVTTPARDAGLPLSKQEADWIYKLAGGHPFFLTLLCHMLFEKKVAASTCHIELAGLEEEAYHKLLPLFRALWQGMDELDRQKLRYELRKADLVDFYDSTLFRYFVQSHAGQQAGLQVKDVKEALKNINKPSILGNSPLRHARVVERYLKIDDPTKASTSEIGVAIREVLMEALERLRGPGTRSDSATGWEFYNILYYCYFKHHMQNEQIAARMVISARTFYRMKIEALEALFTALQKLEDGY